MYRLGKYTVFIDHLLCLAFIKPPNVPDHFVPPCINDRKISHHWQIKYTTYMKPIVWYPSENGDFRNHFRFAYQSINNIYWTNITREKTDK